MRFSKGSAPTRPRGCSRTLWAKSSLLTQQALPSIAIGKRERPSAAIAMQLPGKIIGIEVLVARHQYTETEIAFLPISLHELDAKQKDPLRERIEVAIALSERRSVAGVVGAEGPAVVGRVQETRLIATLQEPRDFMACCCDKVELPEKPLQICKWAEQKEYRLGDVVTFHLKYSNLGGKPITGVAVSTA